MWVGRILGGLGWRRRSSWEGVVVSLLFFFLVCALQYVWGSGWKEGDALHVADLEIVNIQICACEIGADVYGGGGVGGEVGEVGEATRDDDDAEQKEEQWRHRRPEWVGFLHSLGSRRRWNFSGERSLCMVHDRVFLKWKKKTVWTRGHPGCESALGGCYGGIINNIFIFIKAQEV